LAFSPASVDLFCCLSAFALSFWALAASFCALALAFADFSCSFCRFRCASSHFLSGSRGSGVLHRGGSGLEGNRRRIDGLRLLRESESGENAETENGDTLNGSHEPFYRRPVATMSQIIKEPQSRSRSKLISNLAVAREIRRLRRRPQRMPSTPGRDLWRAWPLFLLAPAGCVLRFRSGRSDVVVAIVAEAYSGETATWPR